jgi:predicted membrane-bound spermidine synthase
MQRVKSMLSTVAQAGSVNAQEKIAGIDAALPLITGELALLSTSEDQYGGTMTSVKKSTYGFGFIAGALIGLLIALQLTIVDKRVRSVSQLAKHVDRTDILGHATSDASSIQHVAAALVARANRQSITSIALVPAASAGNTSDLAAKLHAITQPLGVSVTAQPSVSSIDAQSLLLMGAGAVVVAETKRSTTDDVVKTWSVLQSAQRSVLGAILVDAQR